LKKNPLFSLPSYQTDFKMMIEAEIKENQVMGLLKELEDANHKHPNQLELPLKVITIINKGPFDIEKKKNFSKLMQIIHHFAIHLNSDEFCTIWSNIEHIVIKYKEQIRK